MISWFNQSSFCQYFYPFLKYICWGQTGPFFCGNLIGHEGVFFCTGAVLYPLVKNFPNGIKWDYCCLFAFLVFFVLFSIPLDMRGSLWVSFYEVRILLYIVIIASLFKTSGVFKKIFGNNLIVYLGEISFSLYMIHQYTFLTLVHLFPQFHGYIACFSLPIVLVFSSFIYMFFEVLSRKFLRLFFKNPQEFFVNNKFFFLLFNSPSKKLSS